MAAFHRLGQGLSPKKKLILKFGQQLLLRLLEVELSGSCQILTFEILSAFKIEFPSKLAQKMLVGLYCSGVTFI